MYLWRHVRNIAQEHILYRCLKVNMFFIITRKTKFSFNGTYTLILAPYTRQSSNAEDLRSSR